jgi:hypothetical protein
MRPVCEERSKQREPRPTESAATERQRSKRPKQSPQQ